jgi:predicted nucleic acid-binding protein
MESRFKVVLDTNQIVGAGTRWLVDGRPSIDTNLQRKLLIHVAEMHTGLYCGKIIGEYLEKLIDRKHEHDRVIKLISYIMGAFTQVQIVSKQAPTRPSDLDDEIFLLCAIDGEADYLVTDDRHLLNISNAYQKPSIGCCKDVTSLLGVS